ncbi:MAG: DsbA family protein [Bacteroidota bacterium]
MNTFYKSVTALFLGIILVGASFGAQQQVWAQNETESAILIEEFADLQCPSCRFHHFTLKRLQEEFGDQIEVKYYHFPLRSHQQAIPAARATEAAGNQGKFKEMKDLLFTHQNEWTNGNASRYFMRYAQELKLNMDQFEKDLNSQETQNKVMEDRRLGEQRGVRATPTFFVNGTEIEYPRSYEDFKATIEQYLGEE